ncbi:hypothetical protein NX059_006236 [Plenodomus lindquistii]|nr:hypothetical protein NX059_006236 [Plenodomus lindquistii]
MPDHAKETVDQLPVKVDTIALLPGLKKTNDSTAFFVGVFSIGYSEASRYSHRRYEFSHARVKTNEEVRLTGCALFAPSKQSHDVEDLRYEGGIFKDPRTIKSPSLVISHVLPWHRRRDYIAVLFRGPTQGRSQDISLDCYCSESNERFASGTIQVPIENSFGRYTYSGLVWTIRSGGYSAAKTLMSDRQFKPGERDDKRQSLLFDVAAEGHTEIVNYLLEKRGIPVDQKDDQLRTPLFGAAERGHVNVVRALLRKGANWNAKDFLLRSPLSQAAKNNHSDVVVVLLYETRFIDQAGFPMDDEDLHGETPTSLAAREGHRPTLGILVHAALNKQTSWAGMKHDSYKHRYLIRSAQNGWRVLARILTRSNAFPYPEHDFTLPLCVAAEEGHPGIVKLLLEAGANRDATWHGDPIICHAVKAGRKMAVKALIDAGANLEATDHAGKTPDALAAVYNDRDPDLEIWNMILAKREEGRLAESQQLGDEKIDGSFNARVRDFRRENDKMIHQLKIMSVASLLSNHKPSADVAPPEFCWIHLPANNVSRALCELL